MTSIIITILSLIIGGFFFLIILAQPYLGLVFTLAAQPVLLLLPKIPLLSSFVLVIGVITIVAFAFNMKSGFLSPIFRISSTHILGLLLIFWIVLSHPQAALIGRDRNWLFTFIQIWVLLLLAGILLNTPRRHQVLMWAFSISTLISAVIAIQQGGFLEEIDITLRATGLAQGANTAARYFVICFVFLFYLITISKSPFVRLFASAGLVVTFLGVFYTVSRTGMILLAVALVMIFYLNSKFKYRLHITYISTIALLVLMVFSSSIFPFVLGIVPSISHGTDTMGLRYALWDAAWQMWQDHPLSGVGIGMFPGQLRFYPNPKYLGYFQKGLVAHNMYLSMLAETGIIGFGLFITLLINSFQNFWRAGSIEDPAIKSLVNIWLTIFVVILLGGMTKTDQVDKMLWLTMGISVYFRNLSSMKTRKILEESIINTPGTLTKITFQ